MIEVYGKPTNRGFRVIWMLEELGMPYRLHAAAPHDETVRAIYPRGKVPVLRVGEDILTDSVAILTWLADSTGKLTAPAGTIARAHQDAMTNFLLDEFDACLWMAARHSFVLPEELRVRAVKDSLKWEFARSQKELVRRMGGAPFVMGDQMCLADIIATHCGTWARNAKFEITEPDYAAYIDRMCARPAWQRAKQA